MDCPQSLSIPILRLESKMNNGSLGQSESSISNSSGSLSTLNNGKKEKVFKSPEIPFALKKLARNPKDILEKKAAMSGKGIKGESLYTGRDNKVESVTNILKDLPDMKKNNSKKVSYENLKQPKTSSLALFKSNIEAEIDMKLFYLDLIQQLKETLEYERTTAKNETIKATQKIKLLEEEKAHLLELHQEDMKEKTLYINKCQQFQSKLVELCPESLITSQDKAGNVLCGNLVIPQGPCMKFSNLFDLSGQLTDFCCGEYGSKFVIERLEDGASPEKDYAMKELNLPHNLFNLLENPHSAKVATVLAIIEHKGRAHILSHLEENFSEISSSADGRQFIVDVLKSASRTEKLSIAKSASTSISKLQTHPDKNLINILQHLIPESLQKGESTDT